MRIGLLLMTGRALEFCFTENSAGVMGDGRAGEAATLALVETTFSWELGGSMASLLGTGVMCARLGLAREFELVVSLRHGDESGWLGAGLAAVGVEADLPKKPRILCCLPPEAVPPIFFVEDGVFAGVRAGIEDALLGAIVGGEVCQRRDRLVIRGHSRLEVLEAKIKKRLRWKLIAWSAVS